MSPTLLLPLPPTQKPSSSKSISTANGVVTGHTLRYPIYHERHHENHLKIKFIICIPCFFAASCSCGIIDFITCPCIFQAHSDFPLGEKTLRVLHELTPMKAAYFACLYVKCQDTRGYWCFLV